MLSRKMVCPFLENPVDVGAQIVRGALRREGIFWTDMTLYSDEIIYGK